MAWPVALPRDAPITENASTDVCIIGAGIAGLTTAYLLASAGTQVIVDGARIAADSRTKAIEFIERFVRDNDVDCDFARVDGYLFLDEGDTGKVELVLRRPAILTDAELLAVDRSSIGPEWQEVP